MSDASSEKRLRQSQAELDQVVIEAARLLRAADPGMLTMRDALLRAQHILVDPSRRKQEAYTRELFDALVPRIEKEIQNQLGPELERQQLRKEAEELLAKQWEVRSKAERQDLEERLSVARAGQETALNDLIAVQAELDRIKTEIPKVPESYFPLVLTELRLGTLALVKQLGAEIGQQIAQAIAMSQHRGPHSLSATAVLAPAQPEPGNGNGGAHVEDEDPEETARNQARYAAAQQQEETHLPVQGRDFGNLPENCRKYKIAVVGLHPKEQTRLLADFGKQSNLEIRCFRNRGSTKVIADVAIQVHSIFTMNKVTPLDLVQAARKGKHYQIQGDYAELAKKIREKYPPLPASQHH